MWFNEIPTYFPIPYLEEICYVLSTFYLLTNHVQEIDKDFGLSLQLEWSCHAA